LAVPVQIVSGFLGTGKTTAILAQLEARAGERIAVIVNDFGEAALDEAALEASAPFRITSIPGGCVCCTAPEGFADALVAVLDEAPDRLLIEPTGLARPQDLIDTIRRSPRRDDFELAPVVVLVDPAQLRAAETAPETSPLLAEQAHVADVLVANRTDLCDAEDLAHFRKWAGEIWPGPLAVRETTQGRLPPGDLDWPAGEGMRSERRRTSTPRDHARGHSTAGYRARSWKWSPEVVFSHPRLVAALRSLAAGEAGAPLERLKGIFRTQEGVSRLEVSGGVLHDRLTSFRRDSRVDAIVRAVSDDALDRIGAYLEEAILDPEELRLDANRIEVVLPGGAVHGVDRELLLSLPDPMPDVSVHFPKRVGRAARVRALLEHLGVAAQGRAVVVAGDGFASDPVELPVLAEGVLLHSVEGEPLPDAQGGPFRLLIPEGASTDPVSCANVKGVAKIVVRRDAS
jgi:G3E family GTPase